MLYVFTHAESERQQLEEEREAFEVFRGQSVEDLNSQTDQLQVSHHHHTVD